MPQTCAPVGIADSRFVGSSTEFVSSCN